MAIRVDLQLAYHDEGTPSAAEIRTWAKAALKQLRDNSELSVRIVDETESAALNKRWRNTGGPTNVLSFPAGDIPGPVPGPLGDIVICAPVVAREAARQKKKLDAHWAHMVVHGCLHLLGYDHADQHDAEEMEGLEISILENLGFDNPYIEHT